MIDLRSDICDQPTEAMWSAMRAARLGWATLGEDENVNRLERMGAARLGKEAAMLAPTCGMANLAAAMALADPGQAVALGESCHMVSSEAMGVEHVAGLRPVLVPDPGGLPKVEAIPAGVALVVVENTHTRAGGTASGPAEIAARRRPGAALHLDGARIWNASVALGVGVDVLAAPADTVAVSLNKGLCAPYGALLCGRAEVVERARESLRRLGAASIHKAGIMAAAGIVALETMIERLADDHRRAARLAELVGAPAPATNLVLVDTPGPAIPLLRRLAAEGVLAYPFSERRIRLVTHRLIGDAEVERAGEVVRRELALG